MTEPVRLDLEGLPFTVARQFKLSGYVYSHGQLLLRSDPRETGEQTRVDVLFKDTRYVSLPDAMEGLAISLGSEDLLKPHVDDLERFELNFGIRVYGLTGTGWRGFVVAGAIWMLEYVPTDNASPLGMIIAGTSPFGVFK